MTTKAKAKDKESAVVISAPKIETAEFRIVGTAPYVQLRFGIKAKAMMRAKMEAGSQANKNRKKEARDFDEDFRQALHADVDGRHGIPAGAFRNGMISACRLVGFKMTLAKLSVYVEPDAFDDEGLPMVHIEGTPEPLVLHVRNATGVCDLRVRGKFWPWSAKVRVKYDADQFSLKDMANLLSRVGAQVGIGEGRPDSKSSAGMGWGTFRVE
jgi:hypothetical protein